MKAIRYDLPESQRSIDQISSAAATVHMEASQ